MMGVEGKGNGNLFMVERMSKETETESQNHSPELPVPRHHQMTMIDEEEALMIDSFPRAKCCSFFPCFGSQPSPTRSSGLGAGFASSPSMWEKLQQTAESENRWWAGSLKGLKKIREWSEIIAGPKWKTFIRRINRGGKTSGSGKFNYDPLSYSLNFDDGPGHNGNSGDDSNFPDFSSRFASIPLSCKSSMDLGKNGIPSLS